MTFKEFYLEWQQRDYTLAQRQWTNGQGNAITRYQVVGKHDSPPSNTVKTWKIQVANGELKIPPELEGQREQITRAYFKHNVQGAFGQGRLDKSQGGDDETPGSSINIGQLKKAPFNMADKESGSFDFPQNTPSPVGGTRAMPATRPQTENPPTNAMPASRPQRQTENPPTRRF